MASYTISNRPRSVRSGDNVTFVLQGHDPLEYRVSDDHLSLPGHPNRHVFTLLGMDEEEMTKFLRGTYGYNPGTGDWITYRDCDYAAATRTINALFDLIQERTSGLMGTLMGMALEAKTLLEKAPVLPDTASPATEKAKTMATIIRESTEFGCQRENIARLLQTATDIPVLEAYKAGEDYTPGEPSAVSMGELKVGTLLTALKPFGQYETGHVFLVWNNYSGASLRAGAGMSKPDLRGVEVNRTNFRAANAAEIKAYLEDDGQYVIEMHGFRHFDRGDLRTAIR